MEETVKFEILSIDTTDNTVVKSEKNLLHSLLAHSVIWDDPTLNAEEGLIVDNDIKAHVKLVEKSGDTSPSLDKAFLINIEGIYEKIEPIREKLVRYINEQGFNKIYILIDDASEEIAKKLYPLIYKVENRLRAYLIRFMTTKLGPRWWEATATGDIDKKVYRRSDNEKVFGPLVDNNAYLMDFGDLGRMIYSHSSGFTSKEDIVEKIHSIDETPEAIRDLKDKLKSNYQKFFKDTFKEEKFQEKWENLEHIRHKVAHNNLFTEEDLQKGTKIAEELIGIIEKATESVDSLVLSDEEEDAIKGSFVNEGYFDVIEEDEFIEELKEMQKYFDGEEEFVGLSYFVKEKLGPKGYDYSASYDMASQLESRGVVEIYQVDNPNGEKSVSAIKIVESDSDG